jgi:hypothetical protein
MYVCRIVGAAGGVSDRLQLLRDEDEQLERPNTKRRRTGNASLYALSSFVYDFICVHFIWKVSLRLDTSRNELLIANTALSIFACSIAFSAYITGVRFPSFSK